MLLLCGGGRLATYREKWERVPCPLASPELLAVSGPRLACVDNANHALWMGGRTVAAESGIEAALWWRDCLLTLSGDTDCLTLIGPGGEMLLTTPAGIYPQDMCFLPGGNAVAVAGGADGRVHCIRLPSLTDAGSLSLPGNVQRVAFGGGALYALCALEDDGLRCLLCRVPPGGGQYRSLALWPGLPGAVHVDGRGTLWAAASERLCRLGRLGGVEEVQGDFGLIRHMDSHGETLLVSDPVLEALSLVQGGRQTIVREGDVQHGIFR